MLVSQVPGATAITETLAFPYQQGYSEPLVASSGLPVRGGGV
jgi:hypothetical protein